MSAFNDNYRIFRFVEAMVKREILKEENFFNSDLLSRTQPMNIQSNKLKVAPLSPKVIIDT